MDGWKYYSSAITIRGLLTATATATATTTTTTTTTGYPAASCRAGAAASSETNHYGTLDLAQRERVR